MPWPWPPSSIGLARVTVDSVQSDEASSENEPNVTRGMMDLRFHGVVHLGDLFGEVLLLHLDALTEHETDEAPHLHVLAGLLHDLRAELFDRHLRLPHPGLLE